MKTHAKKRHASHHVRHAPKRTHKASPARRGRSSGGASALEQQTTTEGENAGETYTAMETGRPDRDEGRGPLGQEGEGEAQNDQAAALEDVTPELGS